MSTKAGREALIRWAARNVVPQGIIDGPPKPPHLNAELVWTYSGSCPNCGWVIRADLPLLPDDSR